jgi:WD40 repeat protein
MITLKGHTAAVTSVVFSADGKTLASMSAEGNVRLWHAATDKVVVAANSR